MGRPKLTNPRASRAVIRALPAEIRAWKRAAEAAGLSLSSWLRRLANTAAGYENGEER